ncbi:hypothetical protein R1sor_025619 [Riccia sorocarpa]|uniref:Ubiquitin-like protease family profile domain-containing protein n=1 Tax=Riccia sorocarpa TaxID=122646 RepID=A0ABD3GCT1_9MARC
MTWTKLGAKKARETMGRETEYDFDPTDIARQAANEITGMDVQTSPPPLRPVNVSVGTSNPSAVRTLEQGTQKRKEGKKRPRPPKKANATTTGSYSGVSWVAYSCQRTWDSGKLNIRDKCSNVFLKKNWETWRKLAKPPCRNPPKAEVRKSILHYAGLELHGVKVDWSTVDLSITLNTISKERRLAARREVYRLKVKMDGRLVEPVDPDEADKSQKRKKKPASTEEGTPKRPKSEPKPKPSVPPDVAEEQGETFSRKGKEKVDGFPTQPPVDTVAEERLMIKLAMKASRLDSFVDPSLPTPTGQTSGRDNNQMSAADFTAQVNQISGNLPCEGQMTQSMSNMASTLSMAMEEHSRVWKFWASLEDQLAQAKKEEEVLKAKILDLENKKRLMNERVAMMEKKDLYELLEAKMQGYQIANHPGAVGDLENLNLTITQKWTGIPTLDLDKFKKCPSDYPVFAPFAEGWDGWKENCPLCVHPLGFLPSINTGVCKHMFHFNCFWEYASTRRICPTCRTALPDSTYEFFCTIFIPKGVESIDPNTGEKEVMDEEVNDEELEVGRGRHIIRNDVDVLNDNESWRFALLEVNKALKLWLGDVVLPGVSFVTRHRSVDCELDRNGIKLLYKSICNSFKATAENLPKSNSWKVYMTDVFDSYVNLDNDPDVRPLVAGLDAEDFSAGKIPGAAVALTLDDDGPDYETSLSERQRLKIQSDLLATTAEPQRMTRSTRTRLEYEPVLLSTPPPTKHDIVGGTSDTPAPSPPSPIPIDLTIDGLDGSFSPPPTQTVPTNAFVDLVQYISSPENNGSKNLGWPSIRELTKEDLESGLLLGKHLRGDVINAYIKERFIDRGCEKLFNMFFVNTFWFPKASELVARYDRTSHSEEAMISIARLRRSISPKLHDRNSQGQLPAWIFIPIHGSNHWSLAIIRLHQQYCHIAHLDSCVDIHVPTAIFHVLKTFVSLTMKVDVTKIKHSNVAVDQQKDTFMCGIHVLQMLCGADMREERFDHCFWIEGLRNIATTNQVNSFWIVLGLYLQGKMKVPPS